MEITSQAIEIGVYFSFLLLLQLLWTVGAMLIGGALNTFMVFALIRLVRTEVFEPIPEASPSQHPTAPAASGWSWRSEEARPTEIQQAIPSPPRRRRRAVTAPIAAPALPSAAPLSQGVGAETMTLIADEPSSPIPRVRPPETLEPVARSTWGDEEDETVAYEDLEIDEILERAPLRLEEPNRA